jgi:plastocyanin
MRALGVLVFLLLGMFLATPALGANVTATPSSTFTPKDVTITQGDSVNWTNAGGFHNVAFDDDSFIQPNPFSADPWVVSRTFNTAGTFRYYCQVHGGKNGVGMSGTVTVLPPSMSSTGSGGTTTPTTEGGVGGQGQATLCKSQRKFRIRIRQPRGVKIVSAKVAVNGKSAEVSKLVINGKLRQTAEVDLRGLGRGTYNVEIVATTDKGKQLRGTRTYHTCVAKLTSSGLPPL